MQICFVSYQSMKLRVLEFIYTQQGQMVNPGSCFILIYDLPHLFGFVKKSGNHQRKNLFLFIGILKPHLNIGTFCKMNSCTTIKSTENKHLNQQQRLLKTIMIESERVQSLVACHEKEHYENILEFLIQLQILTSEN